MHSYSIPKIEKPSKKFNFFSGLGFLSDRNELVL